MSARAGAPSRPAAGAAYPDDLRDMVERFVAELRFGDGSPTAGLEEAMRYSLLAGGKRIRPVLTLAAARALGGDPAAVLPTAAAIELVHTYSLIHDDLPAMDDDDLRRGRATCHIAFGENVAILAGDGLMAEAYRLILERQAGAPARLIAALRELSDAIGVDGMVGGQYVDVAGAPELDADSLRGMHAMKTGKLIAAAIGVAPLLLGTEESARIALGRFASELGLLFQIVDDILDVTGSEEEMGKPSGTDERLGKRTYVSVFGLERARELAARSHERARAALDEGRGALPAEPRDLELMTDFMYARNA
ncbi:MAG: polyprenyl synthetase family protein [Solirubrobacterales bacterium]